MNDTDVAMMASHILGALNWHSSYWWSDVYSPKGQGEAARIAVALARAVVAEVERTRVDGLASRLAAEPAARRVVEPEQA